jgi:hypothetical protein
MTFFCYVDTLDSDVPYMEPAPTGDLFEAREYALGCMADRARPTGCRIYEGDRLVETLAVDSQVRGTRS